MITIVIVTVTSIISFLAFKKRELFYALSLNPYSVYRRKQWYRLFTCSFVHADMSHLLVNMFVLWSFGSSVEMTFDYLSYDRSIDNPMLSYILLYVAGVVFASIPDMINRKDDAMYNSIGASGGVASVLFASIVISPWSNLYLFFVIPMPKIVFGVAYIAYSYYMGRRTYGSVNHKAHLWGAIFGVLYTLSLNYNFIFNFI